MIVVSGEAFGLDCVALWVGDHEDLAVCEDTVHVEDQDFYVFSAGFSGHSMMISWRAYRPPATISSYLWCLAPVSFNPDVAIATVVPVSGDPAGVGVRRLNI